MSSMPSSRWSGFGDGQENKGRGCESSDRDIGLLFIHSAFNATSCDPISGNWGIIYAPMPALLVWDHELGWRPLPGDQWDPWKLVQCCRKTRSWVLRRFSSGR